MFRHILVAVSKFMQFSVEDSGAVGLCAGVFDGRDYGAVVADGVRFDAAWG
jgi:hypothetical protein